MERVRPFARVGEGPSLTDLTSNYQAVVIKAAAKLVSEERPEYNPLYVWSTNRAGPLALLAATARSFRETYKISNIAVVSSAEFAEDYIRALSEGVAGAWRERWRDVDLLLMYDVELISGTERAKDEFFHLFEASKRTGTKMLITADRAPAGINDIDESLRTRFEMGLVVEAPGKNLPQGAAELNLKEAPPEYMEGEDLWGGFMRPKVADTVIPPVEDLEGAEDGVLTDLAAAEPASAEPLAGKAGPAPAVADETEAAGVGGSGSVWKPSRENVVWDCQTVEERIVELTE